MVDSHSCPRLKCLTLEECTGLYHLNVCCPVLEHLNMEDCYGLDVLTVSGDKLRILDVKNNFEYGLDATFVRISAPSLQSFQWLDYIVGDFYMDKIVSLVDAHVSLVLDPKPDLVNTYLKHATKFLHQFIHAESLLVELPCYWAINEWYPDASLSDKMEPWNYQKVTLDHLHKVTLCGFRGKEHEIEFVKFLLECTPVLTQNSQMTVIFSQTFSNESRKSQIAQELLKFKATSRDAVLSFS